MVRKIIQCSALAVAVFICAVCLLRITHAGAGARAAQGNQNGNRGGAQTPDAPPDAATIYARSCAGCHGNDGRSDTMRGRMMRARNIADAEWQRGISDETMAVSIRDGRGRMPGFGRRLSPEQITALVRHVRSLAHAGSSH